ncbi:MAG: hypothetical protein JW776_05870 [Candidatus Lokiarchaeota archaeon]|nr:hypothetical protein [Candidatus Lokiarchaeota archaeon]
MEIKLILLVFTGLLIVISCYAGVITINNAKTTRNRSLFMLGISWFSWTISYALFIGAEVVEFYYPTTEGYIYWKYVMVAGFFFEILGVFYLILFVDRNSRDSIGLIRITAIGIIGTLYLVLPLLNENQMKYNDSTFFQLGTFLWLVQISFGLLYGYLYIEWIIRIRRHSPKSLRKITTILMIVFIIFSIIAVIGYVSSVFFVYNIFILYIFHGGAILSIIIAIRVEPRIINILPFVCYRLQVLNRKSGVLVYEYAWKKKKQRDLASFIHGIQKVSQDTFRVGELKSLNLQEGLVILEYTEKFTFALFTTKSTTYLQWGFMNFSKDFEKIVKQKKLCIEGVINTVDYEFGDELIQTYFKYIPTD